VLAQFDVSRQVEPKLLEGPWGDFDGYFAAIDQLQTAVDFFTNNRSYKSSDAALHHAKGLLGKALTKLEEEFRHMLATNRCVPSRFVAP
jgi:exocyst complex protein 7